MLLMKNTPFNPDQNPFQFLINGQQPRGGMPPMPQGGPQGGQPSGPAIMGGQPATPPTPDAMQPGKTGDYTKPLLMAISALHSYMAAITDPQEIDLVRKVVSLLTNLIQRDQQRSSAQMQEQMKQTSQSGQPQPGQQPQMGMQMGGGGQNG